MIDIFSSNERLKSQPLSRKNIREIARWLKSELKLNLNQKVDIIQVFEILALLLNYDYEFVSDESMKGKYAETDIVNRVIRVRESVFKRAAEGIPRDRFTIAHEIGHFVFHCFLGFSLCRSTEDVKSYEDPEWQANTFAGEFLADSGMIKGLSPFEVADKYGVSREVALIQLNNAK